MNKNIFALAAVIDGEPLIDQFITFENNSLIYEKIGLFTWEV